MQNIWYSPKPLAIAARLALWPASVLYAAGWNVYRGVYTIGLKTPNSDHPRVLCVGNLTVGGLGKTPLTLAVTRMLVEMGRTVVCGCSGYGSKRAEGATVAPNGPLDPAEWGDEPALLRDEMPDVPLVVGRNRPLAARFALELSPRGWLVMDDGFQHLPIRKAISILVDSDAQDNHFCLPAGPYREPRRNLRLGDIVFPRDFVLSVIGWELVNPMTGEPREAPAEAAVVCGIGRPDKFLADLQQRGVEVLAEVFETDHSTMQRQDLFQSVDLGVPIITTQKDWVKLRERSDLGGKEFLVAIRKLAPSPEEAFRVKLKQLIENVENGG